MKHVSRLFFICSIVLFVMSLTQPAFSTSAGYGGPGWLILIVGIFGPFAGGAGVCWLANPFLMLSWLTFVDKTAVFKRIHKDGKELFWLNFVEKAVSLLFCFFAVIASSSFLLFTQIIINEAGHYGPITDRHLGYWLWLSSTIVMLMGSGIRLIDLYCHKPRKKPGG